MYKDLILDYLNRHYLVKIKTDIVYRVDSTYVNNDNYVGIFDLGGECFIDRIIFITNLKTIFGGDFSTNNYVHDILEDWYESKKEVLFSTLYNTINDISDNLNSDIKSKEILLKLASDIRTAEYGADFLRFICAEYYSLKKGDNIIDEFYSTCSLTSGSMKILDEFDVVCSEELKKVKEMLEPKLINKYVSEYLKPKVYTILNKCDVKITDIGWDIVHKTMGVINHRYWYDEILKNETAEIKRKIVINVVEEWEVSKKEEATEKMMKNLYS